MSADAVCVFEWASVGFLLPAAFLKRPMQIRLSEEFDFYCFNYVLQNFETCQSILSVLQVGTLYLGCFFISVCLTKPKLCCLTESMLHLANNFFQA